MLAKQLVPMTLDLTSLQLGQPQRSGPLTMVPLHGADARGSFALPQSELHISKVDGYGNLELEVRRADGVAIVPLHIGYIQNGAQNHAACRSAFIGAGQKLMFNDACCVQASQGGYLEGAEQWFFILPLELRHEALGLRGQNNYGKLWPAISKMNDRYGLPSQGHLEHLVCRQRFYLTQFMSRLECLPNQRGALFLLGDKLAGVELAPTAAYFAELFGPLVSFSYGPAAMRLENSKRARKGAESLRSDTALAGRDVAGLREALLDRRRLEMVKLRNALAATPKEKLKRTEEDTYTDLRLSTVKGKNFAGQVVERGGELVYASLSARPKYALMN